MQNQQYYHFTKMILKESSVFFSMTVLFLLTSFTSLKAQVSTTGCVAHNFGIDAGLYSNVIEYGTGAPAAGSNDWFVSSGGGHGAINESSPITIQNLLQAGGNPTYERRMVVPKQSIYFGHLMVDAVFARDHFGGTGATDQTSYTNASKNGEDPAIWATGPMNVLGKNDLIDVGGHMFREGSDLSNHLWFTGFINRCEPGGDAYMDFEFYIKKVTYDAVTGFESGGPDEGHTAYEFDPVAQPDGTHNIDSIGDFILNVRLQNGGIEPSVEVRIWVSRADYVANLHPAGFTWGSEFDGASNGSTYGYASIVPTTTDVILCEIVNVDGQNVVAPPWGTLNSKSSVWGTSYPPFACTELALNLTHIGLDHSSLMGADPCFFPIHTFIVKTRSSNAFTAQLKDFAGPYGWGQAELEGLVVGNTEFNCENNTAMVTVSPIRDDAVYTWSTLDGEIIGSNSNDTITVGKPGTYTVSTVISTTNCPIPDTSVYVGVNPNQIPFEDFSYLSTSACYGQTNGSITMSITGAPEPYNWNWSKSGGGTDSNTGTTISGLAPGTYSVTVTAQGGTGCTKNFTTVVNENPQIIITPTGADALCYGTSTGSINLAVTGGSPGYTYLWTGGITTQNRSGLAAGTYNVTVTDSKGCTATASPTIGQSTQLTVTPTPNNITCNGYNNGSINIFPDGGTPAYTYAWSDGPTSQNRSNLIPGTYAVTVTDSQGCTASTGGQVISEPTAITASAAASPILCYGGDSTITVTASGGTAPLQYSLNGGLYQLSNKFYDNPVTSSAYIITVKDNNNCSTTTTVSMTEPTPLILSYTADPETCTGDNDGRINLSVSGGTGPGTYTYDWDNDGYENPDNDDEDLSNLAAGSYTVIVTDANGCTATTTAVVGIANPEPVSPGNIQH